MISGNVIKKRLLFSNLENRLEKMGCFIWLFVNCSGLKKS
ncbi:hypothetical protein SPAR70_1933 [Streptococcus pneumoniae GA41410]|nr:hypothetical protein SPAR70_1933 [Streptococcus pneumoniae GA41410]